MIGKIKLTQVGLGNEHKFNLNASGNTIVRAGVIGAAAVAMIRNFEP